MFLSFPILAKPHIRKRLTQDNIAFVVPIINTVTATKGPAVSLWVGIDGYMPLAPPVIQAGVDVEYAADGTMIYQAWTEVSLHKILVYSLSVYCNIIRVLPKAQVKISVTYRFADSGSGFRTYLKLLARKTLKSHQVIVSSHSF